MNKKRFFAIILSLALLAFFSVSCSKNNGSESSGDNPVENQTDPGSEIIEQPEGKGISFDEEKEGVKLEMKQADVSDYIGSWEATSDQATFLYGNFDLDVKDDGTWTANITDEEYSGTWTEEGDHLHMSSDRFSFDLGFEASGKLILTETTQEGSELHTVLTKK